MQAFVPGQRWISESEPELGLGSVLGRDGRLVRIEFPAAGETRSYAAAGAPLSRVRFAPGDLAESAEGWQLQVEAVGEQGGLLSYRGRLEDGQPAELPEQELNSFMQLRSPAQRLLNGLTDPPHWFALRHRALDNQARNQRSPLRGLLGARIAPVPHQLYIAQEVARRQAPRVLLADEVGLGKTIEAGLILHRQLLTGRARRVLILVPEPLLHQWLVELLRRFNLRFSLFDQERCEAIVASGQAENPFLAEQLVLCPLPLVSGDGERRAQALAGDWDLLVVDEAHHLAWDEGAASPEYQAVAELAAAVPGLLLLTATPEQLGQSGHFARLRLLDPDRFFDLAAFRAEEAEYRLIADAADLLLKKEPLPGAARERLAAVLDDADSLDRLAGDAALAPEDRERLIERLLDRHGTGRVLFRNTRAAVRGFPPRELHPAPLPAPAPYAELPAGPALLTPERACQAQGPAEPWWTLDPRMPWLVGLLQRLDGAKLLLICARAETACELEQALRSRTGTQAALFHEGMSLLERDRAAAWFADPEQGARLLICSEIGSEGRNFQFAHHLALFDLPLDPDLLEQRIGRLDRIGQRETIRIHVPYLEPGPQAALFHWYRDGLDAFSAPCPAAHSVFERLQPALVQALEGDASDTDLALLLTQANQLTADTNAALQQGRDHLLELNSCRQPQADALREALQAVDADPELPTLIAELAAAYGLELEEHGPHSWVLRPSEQMRVERFPGLPEDGLTLTYDRATALAREDFQFLTWEHPLVEAGLEMMLGDDLGNSALCLLPGAGLSPGRLLLEALYVLDPVAPRRLQSGRFLPPTLVRVLVDEQGRELGERLDFERVQAGIQSVERSLAGQAIRERQTELRQMLVSAGEHAEARRPSLQQAALAAMMQFYTGEIQRLQALAKVNPNVRPTEIQALQQEALALHRHLGEARLRLDALRVIVSA